MQAISPKKLIRYLTIVDIISLLVGIAGTLEAKHGNYISAASNRFLAWLIAIVVGVICFIACRFGFRFADVSHKSKEKRDKQTYFALTFISFLCAIVLLATASVIAGIILDLVVHLHS